MLRSVGRSVCCGADRWTVTPSACPLSPGRTEFPGSTADTEKTRLRNMLPSAMLDERGRALPMPPRGLK